MGGLTRQRLDTLASRARVAGSRLVSCLTSLSDGEQGAMIDHEIKRPEKCGRAGRRFRGVDPILAWRIWRFLTQGQKTDHGHEPAQGCTMW